VFVQEGLPSFRDKEGPKVASKLTTLFGSKLVQMLSSRYFALLVEKPRSRSVQEVRRKLLGGHGRVFSVERG
jgi:hypothetical protein